MCPNRRSRSRMAFRPAWLSLLFWMSDILMMDVVLFWLTTSFRGIGHIRRSMIAFSRVILCLTCPRGKMFSKSEVVLVSSRIWLGNVTCIFAHDNIARSLMMGKSGNAFHVSVVGASPCVVCSSKSSWFLMRRPRLPSSESESVRLIASFCAIKGNIRGTPTPSKDLGRCRTSEAVPLGRAHTFFCKTSDYLVKVQ